MTYTFLSATVLLILITDPIGNIPIFANALKHVAPERRTRVILREIAIAYGVLLSFLFAGQAFLRVMGLSEVSLQLAGAVVLFLIAIRMIFPPPDAESAETVPTEEPLIVPLAIPAVAGPSAMATVILLASSAPERRIDWIGAVTVAMLVSAVVLVMAERIQRVIGNRVVLALERLMGLILVAVAVEMSVRALRELLRGTA